MSMKLFLWLVRNEQALANAAAKLNSGKVPAQLPTSTPTMESLT